MSEEPTAPVLHDPSWHDFASDNCAGAHPRVMAALAAANGGHQDSYGGDVYTARLGEVVREHFGPRAEAYPVFNGTGANLVALQAMTSRWQAVICPDSAHLNTDETAGPEHAGLKLLTVPAPEGKLTPEGIRRYTRDLGNMHHAQPGVVSVSQTTELGTCYTPGELEALATEAHAHGLGFHLDGARLANAAATLGVSPARLTTEAGVDVISFGATKNGTLYGDCVIVLDPDAVSGTAYVKKATTQLPSKARFVSAQLLALLSDGLWLDNARHANAMATLLADGLSTVPGVRLVYPVEANAVFAVLPEGMAERLRERYSFGTWDPDSGVVRLMTAFDTTEDDVHTFVKAARTAG
ncbi:threonine aldolase family protein [Streptomyces iconiensis]|uniref:Low specificity L-threonine aldolase n=1 Tax=Streptomyces iconiensis TaxID=1384038 RepID=A0ABT7A700_9ACTN|nr:low specificity L-threonine aldolase [Streptomyces iconiensis]MDJ1137107.1 low specificity L-threonine aldolase [Streptomyces iconiensis]